MTGVAKIQQGPACEGAMTDEEINACKPLLLKKDNDDNSTDEEPEEIVNTIRKLLVITLR